MGITVNTTKKDLYNFFESDMFKKRFFACAKSPWENPSYYTMHGYFCNGHDDTATDVKVFNDRDECLGYFTFCYGMIDEVTPQNIDIIAERFAKYLEEKYMIKRKV